MLNDLQILVEGTGPFNKTSTDTNTPEPINVIDINPESYNSSNFQNEKKTIDLTINEMINLYTSSKDPTSPIIIGLSDNQRLYVKELTDKINFFRSTFNGMNLPSLSIAAQDIDFYNTEFVYDLSDPNSTSVKKLRTVVATITGDETIITSDAETDEEKELLELKMKEELNKLYKSEDETKEYLNPITVPGDPNDHIIKYKTNGFNLEHNVIKDYENSTGISRETLKTTTFTLILYLIQDGQQRTTMSLIIFYGSYNGLTAHINLDRFSVSPNDLYVEALSGSLEFFDVNSNEYKTNLHRKLNPDELADYISEGRSIINPVDKKKYMKSLNNYFPASDIKYWEGKTPVDILTKLGHDYGIIALTPETKLKYLRTIDALYKYFFTNKLFSLQTTKNMTPEQMILTFNTINTNSTRVSPMEIVAGELNAKIGKEFEDLLTSYTRFFLRLGVNDETEARGYAVRTIVTGMGWTTSMNDLIDLFNNKDKTLLDGIKVLKNNMYLFRNMLKIAENYVTTNGKITEDITNYTRNGKEICNNIDIGLLGLMIILLAQKEYLYNKIGNSHAKINGGKHTNKIVLDPTNNDEKKFLFQLLLISEPLSKVCTSTNFKSFAKMRTIVDRLTSIQNDIICDPTYLSLNAKKLNAHGQKQIMNGYLNNAAKFNVANLIMATTTDDQQNPFIKSLDDIIILTPNNDRKKDRQMLLTRENANDSISTVVGTIDFGCTDIEHILAVDNFKSQDNYSTYTNDGNKLDNFQKQTHAHAKKLSNTIINKMPFHLKLNRSVQKKSPNDKFHELAKANPANALSATQKDYLNYIGTIEMYRKKPDILKCPGHETIILFNGYFKEIRAREKANAKLCKFINEYYTYIPKTPDEIFEMYVTKTFYHAETGKMLYPNILRHFKATFNTIKDCLE